MSQIWSEFNMMNKKNRSADAEKVARWTGADYQDDVWLCDCVPVCLCGRAWGETLTKPRRNPTNKRRTPDDAPTKPRRNPDETPTTPRRNPDETPTKPDDAPTKPRRNPDETHRIQWLINLGPDVGPELGPDVGPYLESSSSV
jgi:hypothetical protein